MATARIRSKTFSERWARGRGCTVTSASGRICWTAAVTAPPAEATAAVSAPAGQALLPGNATAHLIDVAQVQGQVHAQSVHRVGELAERNPNETVAIVRQWLSEGAEAT